MLKTWQQKIAEMGACSEAIEWTQQYDTPEQAWAECERGDWMLWLLGELSGSPRSKSRKGLVLAACECARLALPYMTEGEERPLKAIETAEKWARGGATLKEVRVAAYAAYAAANAAYAAYAANAAYAAANAVYAAYAANATNAAAYAVYAAKKETLAKCADIVRKHYPEPPKVE